MSHLNNLKNSTALSLVSALLLTGAVSPATAQDADADAEAELEEVVVTGSRIPRKDIVANSPVNVITSEEITLSSSVEIDRLLDALPQTVSSNGPTTNNPGNGTASVNLRNLGTVRTLVLVNGRRFVGESTTGVVDLNNIPPALIERVEVVTGGASAVYGSDAMAGVVNFIMKRDFEGVQVSSQYGITQEGDSDRVNVDLTLGTNFADGRGNITLHGNYFNRSRTLASEREFAATQFNETTDDNGNPIFVPGGSSRIPEGRFSGSGLNVFVDSNGSLVNYDGDQHAFNFAPFNNLQLPLERWSMSGTGNYELTDGINLFTEMTFTNSKVNRELAPTPFAESGFTIDLNNPFIPANLLTAFQGIDADGDGLVTQSVFRRMLEAGSRVNADNHNLYRFVVGANGEFSNGMVWEVFYNYGRSEESQRQDGNIVISRFQQGLLVDPDDPTQCSVQTNGCVVLNPFGEGNFTQEMVDFVTIAATNLTAVEQQQVGANVAGDIFELPAGAVGMAAGVEYRKESSETNPDTFLATGDIDGFNAGLPTAGSFDVKEFYAEAVVPILADTEGAQYLGLEMGVRFSDYSTAGGVTSYKIGGEWRPVEDLKIRGLYQRAVRAPNVQELFLGQSNSFPGATDFCDASANPTQAEQDFCVNSLGVPADAIVGFQQEDSQIEVLLGGNPDLFEETSDTWSVGFVYTPESVPGLLVSADYFSIRVEDAIAQFGGGLQQTIDACRADLSLQNEFCSVLTARRADGQLEQVPQFNQNIALRTSKGLDFNASYSFEAWGGNMNLVLAGTRTFESDRQGSPIVPINECVGTVGVRTTCGRADPKWRGIVRGTYNMDDVTVSLRYRYIGKVTDERVALGTRNAADTLVPVIGAEHYLDATFSYDLRENLNLFMTVDNLLNNEPPVFGRGAAGQFNTDSGTYDVLGRRFTVGFRANF